MFGLGGDDDEEQTEELTEDTTEEVEEEPEPDRVLLVKDTTKTFEYTEHDVEVGFANGDSRDFTFDEMEEKQDAYVLYDYFGGLDTGCGSRRELRPNGTKKVATIQKRNLNFIDTTRREKKEMSEEVQEECNMERGEAVHYAQGDDDLHIEELDE